MKEAKDVKSIAGGFVGKYLILAIIIGGISFFLENLIPQIVHWELNSTRAIYQSVLFIISTLLAVIIAADRAIKNAEFKTLEDAKETLKPIKTLLIFVALFVLLFNLAYFYGIRNSAYKDIENKYQEYKDVVQVIDVVDGEIVTENMISDASGKYKLPESKMNLKVNEEKYTQMFLNVYLAAREIITILTYAYSVLYIEKMIECQVVKKPTKKRE